MHIGFLGYGENRTGLIDFLRTKGHRITSVQERIDDLGSFDRVVSFGYRHILRDSVLATSRHPVMNLHISYLPFNKGAHPNFWAWIEGTPHGVTLHEMTDGIDEGPIVAQRRVTFQGDFMTFRDSYNRLVKKIEDLFVDSADAWLSGDITATPQRGGGTMHRVKDLPDWMTDWDMLVHDAIERYHHVG